MDVLGIVVKVKSCYSIYEYVCKMMRKYNVCVGLGVLLFAVVINTYVGLLPLYILQFIGHIKAIVLKTSYEAVAESWEVTLWQLLLAKGLALLILAYAVHKEIRMVLSGVNRRNRSYRVAGCWLIVIYAVGVCIGNIVFRYSVATILFNWWFWPMLIVYVIMGAFIDEYIKRVVGVSEEVKVKKKKRKKKCKK